MIAHARARGAYAVAAIGAIALGLWVHVDGAAWSPDARDVLGDALWAAMLTWCVGAVAPTLRIPARGAMTFGLCVAVEVSQLVHTPALDAARATVLGGLVLGSGFDPRDLASYAVGIITASLLERTTRRVARRH